MIISTDDQMYGEFARKAGAEFPFLRPSALAEDDTLDIAVFTHALEWLDENEGYRPEMVVHLRPTYPIRDPADIDRMVAILRERDDLDSIRSITPAALTPFKMWFRNDDGLISPVASLENQPESHSMPRQQLPMAFIQNASIDVVRSECILKKHSMAGNKVFGYIMHQMLDIDTAEEFDQAERAMRSFQDGNTGHSMERKTFVFDIDGVIATLTPENEYQKAQPIYQNISVINTLKARGNTIILNTARGFITGIDWETLTRKQMADWNVQYDRLLFGKPAGDYYVDDRMISMAELEKILSADTSSGRKGTNEYY